MHFAGLADVFAPSSHYNHWHPQSGPPQDLWEEGNLLWAVHLVLQDCKADNMKDHYLLIS